MSRIRPASLLLAPVLLVALAHQAEAGIDLTGFLGTTVNSPHRPMRGLSVGVSVLAVGFEFEYFSSSENIAESRPSLRGGMFSGMVQTPFAVGGITLYGSVGAGVIRQGLAGVNDTGFGIGIGGGVKVNLAGPLRLRVDYRRIKQQGNDHPDPMHRLYAGLTVAF
jgi:opacity protein-like surface antigen